MKIIFLIDSLRKGGKERRMLELIKGLLKKPDMHIELVLFKDLVEYPEIYDLKITRHIIKRKPKYNPLTFLKLYKIAKQFQPDLFHSWSSMASIFALPSIRLLKIKLINGNIADAPKNMKFWNKRFILAKLTFPYSDVFVGNSKAGLKAFQAPKSKSICIPNGFDSKRAQGLKSKEEIKGKYNLGTNFVVGKVAAFADRKDYETFITSAQLILKVRNDIIFFAIGNGPKFESIKNSVPESIRGKIIFTSQIGDVESIVNVFDIGVLCTNNDVHGEGISNSILEYMAMGKPVIATEGGGTNEIVVDGETGFLMPQKSPEILTKSVLELIGNPNKSIKMGMLGKKRIDNHFSLDKMTSVYLNLYYELMNEKNGFKDNTYLS